MFVTFIKSTLRDKNNFMYFVNFIHLQFSKIENLTILKMVIFLLKGRYFLQIVIFLKKIRKTMLIFIRKNYHFSKK